MTYSQPLAQRLAALPTYYHLGRDSNCARGDESDNLICNILEFWVLRLNGEGERIFHEQGHV